MQTIPEATCQAVRRAYEGMIGVSIRDETIAFEAGVIAYRHLHPDTAEPLARDRVAQVIADSFERTELVWLSRYAS